MIIWDGTKFYHEPDNEKGREMISRGLAQDAGKEDGFSLAYDYQFPLKGGAAPMYQTRELRAKEPLSFNDKENLSFGDTEAAPEAVETVCSPSEPEPKELDWEDFKSQYKKATGAIRARKESVIEWMSSEGLI